MIRTVCFSCLYISCELGNIVKMSFYAVAQGRVPGVYPSWKKCQENVFAFPGAKFKKFSSEKLALEFVNENKNAGIKRKSDDCEIIGEVVPSNKKRGVSSCLTKSNFIDENTGTGSSCQRCLNLDSKHEGKIHSLEERVRTLEEKMEALEATNVLVFNDSNEKESDFQIVDDSSPAANNLHTGGKPSTLRSKLLQAAIEPVAVGSSRSYSTSKTDLKRNQPSELIDLRSFRTDSEGFVQVYTDGACSANGRARSKAGVGVWFNDGHPLNVSEPVRGRATNNVAEIQAATRAVQAAASAGVKKLCIMTDSMFMIDCMSKWVVNWMKNDWKTQTGRPVINKHDLVELLGACKANNIEVKWTHVRGHAGIRGNERADSLARAGADRYRAVGVPTVI